MERPPTPQPNIEAIRNEILERIARDQDMRTQELEDPDVWDDTLDPENTEAMKRIVAQIGWPKKSAFGEEVSSAAWLLVQHADHDPVFQQKCLDLMKQLPEDEVSRIDIAYLEDRICVNTGRGQVYGTQFEETKNEAGVAVLYEPKPIEDFEHVDERRAAVGLEPFQEYKIRLTKKYFPHLL